MRLRTLVVEDDERSREKVARLLRSHGHIVVAMADAETAFEAHRRNPFDLMVVDWVLKGSMTGVELCRKVRALPGGDYVSLLMMTGRTSQANIDEALDAGATDYIKKPVDEDALRTRIRVAERTVADSTRRLGDEHEQAKVRAQLVMADRLSSMGTLAAGVAHEINNPLASLTANLAYIGEHMGDPKGGEVAEALADALRSAERVTDIVGALSRFARAEHTDAEPIGVEGVLDTVAQVLSNEIRHKAKLVRDYGGVSPAMADEGRLGQVFLNLLKNAVDALPDGHSEAHEIRLSTRNESGYVVVEVSDTGPGVDPKIASRIFDPFFTTHSVGGGIGLGLSLCHGIVSGLGGTIELIQGSSRGATFRVRLQEAVPESKGRKRRRTPSSPLNRPILGGRVLIIDDERLIRRSIKRTLVGHDVSVAENGREGLELCLKHDFDIVLCDLMMPEVSGMELFERLAEEREEVLPRIVFMTGGAFTPAAREFLDNIDNLHLLKPFDVRELRAVVADRVAERRQE